MSLVWKYQRGKTWYLAYAKELGLPPESLGTRDEKLAEAVRLQKEHTYMLGKYGIKDGPIRKISWSEFGRLYLVYKSGQGKATNTVDAIWAAINNLGVFLVNDVPLERIQLRTLEDFAAWKRTTRKVPMKTRQGDTVDVERKPAAEKTIRNELILLRTALKWAVRERYLRANPADELELPKKVKRPPRNIQDAEYWRLMEKFESDYWRDVMNFYLLTGIRREEGLKLRVQEHVDFLGGTISIPQGKSKDFKVLRLAGDLRPIVARLVHYADASGQFILCHEDTLTTKFREARDAAGLSPRITFHSLRHTFATNLARAGASFKTIQELLGQSDPDSAKIYTHAYEEEIKKAAEKIQLPSKVTKESPALDLHPS